MQILFGILTILAGIGGVLLFGVFGLIATIVLAVLAFVFAASAKKNGGSPVGGRVLAVIGVVLGVIAMLFMIGLKLVLEEGIKKYELPILESCTGELTNGFVGFATKLEKEGFTTEDLQKEIDTLQALTETTAQ